jgi:glucosamine-6-phosphate deaminase
MRLLIEDDFEGLSARTAAHIAACVTAAASSDRPFVLGVPGGNSVLSVYRRLVAMHKAGGLDMAHVVLFGLDECVLRRYRYYYTITYYY